VLAIPAKRHDHAIVSFLTAKRPRRCWPRRTPRPCHGRRDHTLLLVATQTGLRVSELTSLTVADAHLGTGPHVYCLGKGRKEARQVSGRNSLVVDVRGHARRCWR
jgi:integrase/recombinase XerD